LPGIAGFAYVGGGETYRTLKIQGDEDGSAVWVKKQNLALDEYIEVHVKETGSAQTLSLYKLFGVYIGNALHEPHEKKPPNILDVGCGIGRRLPPYMRMLHHDINYIGLDAFEMHLDRDYSFICSRLETLMKVPAFKNKFDILLFGTSLDHFEDIGQVAAAVQYLAVPGAKVIFWIGLHDIDLTASEEGANQFRRVFRNDSYPDILLRCLGFIFWSFPRVTFALLRNRFRLKRKQKIDDFHFHYFTERDLPGVLAKFGEITDITSVPGGGSVFVTCCVSA